MATKGGIVSVAKRIPMYVDPQTIQTMMRLNHSSGPERTVDGAGSMTRRTLQVRA
jgi:hypothetical protein